MRKNPLFLTIGLLLLGYSVGAAATGLQPLMILGPKGPAGSTLVQAFSLHVDRNGDGAFDYFMIAHCNGHITGNDWSGSVGQETVGQGWAVPVGGSFRAELTSQQCESGIYSWNLAFVDDATKQVTCSISGDCGGQISSTCELLKMLPQTTDDQQATPWGKIFGSPEISWQQVVPWPQDAVMPSDSSTNQRGGSAEQPAATAKPNVE